MRTLLLAFLMIVLGAAPLRAEDLTVGFVTGAAGLGDMSFNDMAYGGLRKAQQEDGFRLLIVEALETGRTTQQELDRAIAQSDLLVMLGAQHTELTKKAAKAHPDKKFILFEAVLEGYDNVRSVVFRQDEGAFLAGALAALVSETGRIGFLGATRIGPLEDFLQGYRMGATEARPGVDVVVQWVTPPQDYSGFSNPEKGFDMAMAMYADDVDVIFAVAGLTGNGVIAAARKAGHYAIGVDSDQDDMAKGFVLTSMVKRLDNAAYLELKRVGRGIFEPGVALYGLAQQGVGLTEMKYTRDQIDPEALRKVDELRQKILSGDIVVP